jgi:endonuclease/exonuclease/phosphatase family metal-dependent hydrolase
MNDGQDNCAFPAETGTGRRLRILSYNIQVGIHYSGYRHYLTRSWKHVLPFTGRLDNLDSIAQCIAGFDIVGLQEVDAGSLRSSYINQTKYLAHHAGFPHWYSQTNRNLGRMAQHSLGLLAGFRPKDVAEYKLPGRIPGRGALIATYGSGPQHLMVGIVHLALGRKARARQLLFLSREIQHHEHVILMGDFNCPIEDESFQRLIESTHLCLPEREMCTYPSWRPKRGLDHILVTPSLKVEHARVYKAYYSDHLPIAVDLRLPEGIDLRPSYFPAPTPLSVHNRAYVPAT